MIFLMSMVVLEWVAVFSTLRSVFAIWRSSTPTRNWGAMREGTAMFATAILVSLPLMIEFVQIGRFASGEPISIAPDYLPLWLLGAGGALGMFTYGLKVLSLRKQPVVNTLVLGVNTIAFLASGYMVAVVADQLAFYLPRSDDTGSLNWGLVRQQTPVHDVQCDSPLMVVKGMDGESATYRCPLVPIVVMGRFTGTPIVPWPTYTEGSSQQLAHEMRVMTRNAVDLTKPE